MVAKLFSKGWNASKSFRKQRKYRFNAPNHVSSKFCNAPLSKTLRKTHKTRSVRVRVGDVVKVTKGDYKGSSGKVTHVLVGKQGVRIDGVNKVKEDGTKVSVVIRACNVLVTGLNSDIKNRFGKKGVKK